MFAADTASAQQEPSPPPDTPPESRLTMTPAEFERWLGRAPAGGAARTGTVPATPRLASPPPPPILAAPPPRAPSLPLPAAPAPVAPPPPPTLEAPAKPRTAAIVPPESGTIKPPALAIPDAPLPEPVRIVYAADATDLPAAARSDLDALADWLRDKPDVRIDLLGYASESSTTGSQARRKALLRVIAVREYLVGRGVLSTRMNVRALGDQATDGPRDRVEIKLPPS